MLLEATRINLLLLIGFSPLALYQNSFMILIGQTQTLKVGRFAEPGAYLQSSEGQEVLLPNKYLTPDLAKGDEVEVFVYPDSEDRPVATTEQPYGQKGQFACLQVKDVNRIGAFLDWGLEKDLLLPYSEQPNKVRIGQWVLVYIHLDPKTHRLIATNRIHHYLSKEIELEEGQEVDLLIAGITDLGTQVVVNDKYLGLLYHNEVFEDLNKGEHKPGFVKKIREDGKIDVSLRKTGLGNLESGASNIMALLEQSGGTISLNDKSDPEDIMRLLQMSKKSFKRSLGILYKKGLVELADDHTKLK